MNALKNQVVKRCPASGYLKRLQCLIVIFCLGFEQAGFAQVAPQFVMPAYLQNLAPVADQFHPVHLRSIALDPETDRYTVFLDKGDADDLQPQDADEAAKRLMSYFEIGLRLPNSMFWVNLRPDSPQNVVDPYLAQTDVGKILLEADLLLKKDLARFTSPDTAEGRQYWDALYKKAERVFGSEDVEIPTLTRPWIVPGEIIIAGAQDRMYIYKATLKVMLEQDHLKDASFYNFSDPRMREMNAYSSELIRAAILPKLTREVNASKRYAGLRQVYYSLILAQQLKQKQGFAVGPAGAKIDTKDLGGFVSVQPWSADTYYAAYRKSFSEGEYDREDTIRGPNGISIRRYFSGGAALQGLGNAVTVVQADGGNLEKLALTNRNLYELSLDARPSTDLTAEQEDRDNAIAELRGLMAVTQYWTRNFEEYQRKHDIKPVVPFDLQNPDHVLVMKQYIKDEYSDVDDQSVKVRGYSNQKHLKSRSEKIKEFTKSKKLNASYQLTIQVFDFVVPPEKDRSARSARKLNMAVLSIINRHHYKDGHEPLTRAIFDKKLQEKGRTRSANMRLYFRVLEYLGIAEIVKNGKEEIALKGVNKRLLKTWFPDIETYDSITFDEIKNVAEVRDGGQDLTPAGEKQTHAAALFVTFWQSFVATYRNEYFGQFPSTALPSAIPYDPARVGQFAEYITNEAMLDKKGKFDTGKARRWAKQNGIFAADDIRKIIHLLAPGEYDYRRKRALGIMAAHDYTRGPLTLAEVDAQIPKPNIIQSGGNGKQVALNQIVILEFLSRLQLIDIQNLKGNTVVILKAYPSRFKAVYPHISEYGNAEFKQEDNRKKTIEDMFCEEWVSQKGTKNPKSAEKILDDLYVDKVNRRLGKTNGDGVRPQTVTNVKTGLRAMQKWSQEEIDLWVQQRQQGMVYTAQKASAQDGGSHAEIFIQRLWDKFVLPESRRSYGPVPVAEASLMREFRLEIQRAVAQCETKTKYFSRLNMNINMSTVYSLNKLLFEARKGDEDNRAGIRALIANHDYETDGPLTVATLQSRTHVGKGAISSYVRALAMLHAVNLADLDDRDSSKLDVSIVSVNPDILTVWVEDDVRDGGEDQSAAETNVETKILQFFITRCAKDNKLTTDEFYPQHDLEHAQLLRDYLDKRFSRVNPQERAAYLMDVKEARRKMGVSETQFCQVADFLLSQRDKKGVVVLDKPVLWAIFTGASTLEKINLRIKGDYAIQPQKYRYYIKILTHVGVIVKTEKNGKGATVLKEINPKLMKKWFPDILEYKTYDVRPAAAYKEKFAKLLADELRKKNILPEQAQKDSRAFDEALAGVSSGEVKYNGETASPRSITDYKKQFKQAAVRGELRSLFQEYGITFEQSSAIAQGPMSDVVKIGSADGGIEQPETTGGVDLRALATVQPQADAFDTVSAGRDGLIPEEAFRAEWRPYVSQCKTPDGEVSVQQVRAYLAAILRAEEDYGVSTPTQVKEILVFIG